MSSIFSEGSNSTREASLSQKHQRLQADKLSKLIGKENKVPPVTAKVKAVKSGTKKVKAAVPGVPQQKLVLKPTKKKQDKKIGLAAEICRPLPFITKTNLYDEHWVTKQERSFIKWLNFILAPIDHYGNILPTQGKSISQVESLTFDEVSTSSNNSSHPLTVPIHLSQRRLLSRWRQAASSVFQSEPYTHVMSRLEIEIESGRLAIRCDRSPHSDVGAREALLQMLLSYNPIWLKLGLETIFGEEIVVINNQQSLSQVLSLYIQSRLLNNHQIADQYYQPTVLGHYGQGFNEALCQFILKKFLLLILLLDKAKLTRLIDHNPCLFVKDAQIKSSREMLLSFSRNFLSGEGDLTRHLQHLGYSVSHVQSSLDEFDYTVTNLATDLQDGLRLTRLAEILTGEWKFSEQLRTPATTKMQKLHNVEIALKSFSNYLHTPAGTTTQSIVEGHREKTLTLLWAIIFHFKVKLKLNMQDLQEEINYLSRQKTHPIASEFYNPRRSSIEPNIFFQATELSLLLQWCRGVGRIYGVPVSNFNSSFSDGRLLCYLIHHYQPGVLPHELISNETTLSQSLMTNPPSPPRAEPMEENFTTGWIASFSPTTGRNKEKERLLANEKSNFKLLAQKLPLLGSVPLMVHFKDMSNTLPDEKVVIAFVSYLCHRLLLLRKETCSAVILQRAWRRIQSKRKEMLHLIIKIEATVIIQAHVRGFLTRKKFLHFRSSVVFVQRLWRATKEMERERNVFLGKKRAACIIQRAFKSWKLFKREHAATIIQTNYRGYVVRRVYCEQKRAACVIQKFWRSWHAHKLQRQAAVTIQSNYRAFKQRCQYKAILQAIVVIQTRFRALLLAHEERSNYLRQREGCIVVQRAIRQFLLARANKRLTATIKIQSTYKAFRQRKQYLIILRSVRTIQSYIRATLTAKQQRVAYLKLRASVIVLQSYMRRWQVQKMMATMHKAATTIQASYRGHLQKEHYSHVKQSVRLLQVYWRATLLARQTRREYLNIKKSAVVIQAHFRRWQVQRKITQQHQAATIIQSWIRCYNQRKQYLTLKHSVIVLQMYWRATLACKKERMTYCRMKEAAVVIQSYARCWQVQCIIAKQHRASILLQAHVRGHLVRKQYTHLKSCIITLQKYWRATLLANRQRKAYMELKQAIVVLQSHYRRYQVQQYMAIQHRAAMTIQANVRGYFVRTSYLALKKIVQTLQTYWKATLLARQQRKRYLEMKQAAIVIQSHFKRWQVEQQVKLQHTAAIVVQSHYRAYITRKYFLVLKTATILIQTYWRATLVARTQHQKYLEMKYAARVIQASYRHYRKYKAAICIQAYVKAFLTRQQYMRLKNAAIIIQARWRAQLAMRQTRTEYLMIYDCIVFLQACTRRQLALKRYQALRQASITLQAHTRGYLTQKLYKSQKQAAIKIQSCLRGYWTQRNYQQMRKAAITVQSVYRGHLIRHQVLHWHNAATVIQRAYHRYRAYKLYHAATVIQTVYRGYICWRDFHNMKQSAIVLQRNIRRYQTLKRHIASMRIQTAWRRYKALTIYNELRSASILIQAIWRGYSAQKRYNRIQQAVLTVQSYYRMYRVQQEIALMHKAAVCIQSIWRGYSIRLTNKKQHAATLIQSQVRGFLAQRSYCRQRNAAITIQQAYRQHCLFKRTSAAIIIQSHWRGYVQRQSYSRLKLASLFIQAWYRMVTARRKYIAMKSAAIVIQANIRMSLARLAYRKTIQAIVIIQRKWQSHYNKCQVAATIIQSAVRGYIQRKCYKQLVQATIIIQSYTRMYQTRQHYIQRRNATIVLQAVWRGYSQYRSYRITKQASIVIQRHWRALIMGRQVREEYQAMQHAILTLQSYIRVYQVRKTIRQCHKAATVIQKAYRHRLTLLHHSATIIQAYYKCYKTRKSYNNIKHVIMTIQRYYRAFVLGRKVHQLYLQRRANTITVQAVIRGWLVCKHLKTAHHAAVTLQKNVRRYQALQRYCIIKEATITIQRYTRGHFARCNYQIMYRANIENIAASLIQAHIKGYLTRSSYLATKQAAIIIQKNYRCYRAVQQYQYMQSTIVKLQTIVRGFLAHRHYTQILLATRVLQVRLRATLLARQEERRYSNLKRSAIVIQSAERRRKARIDYCSTRQAVVKIQQWWRYRRAIRNVRETIHKQHTAAIKIQSWYKMQQCRLCYLAQKRSAIKIQTYFRCYRTYVHYKRMHSAVIVIQQHYRAHVIAVKQRAHYQKMRRAAIIIQRNYRACLAEWEERRAQVRIQAAVCIQRIVRGYLVRHSIRRMQRAATQIQAYWHGYRERYRIKSRAIRDARRRVEKANRSAKESITLRTRLPSMLDALHNSQYLSTVIDILKSFELITSVSQRCSQVIVDGNALTVLYDYINKSNRSRATLEMVKVCLQILLNVTKWPLTQHSVLLEPGALPDLVDFMQKVYITQPDVMHIACQLLQRYYQLHPFQQLPEVSHRKLVSMQTALQRKIKLQSGGGKGHHYNLQQQQLGTSNLHQICLNCLDNIV